MIDDLARLKTQLQITKLSIDKPQLYQLLLQMIDGLISVTKSVDNAIETVSNNSNKGLIKNSSITIKNDDIITLPTIPITILPAPANNITRIPFLINLKSNFITGYGNIDSPIVYATINWHGASLWSNYLGDDSVPAIPISWFSSVFASTGIRRVSFIPWTDSTDISRQWGSLAPVTGGEAGLALEFSIINSSNLTLGDPANFITITSYYVDEPI